MPEDALGLTIMKSEKDSENTKGETSDIEKLLKQMTKLTINWTSYLKMKTASVFNIFTCVTVTARG
jgi:hypothetical protein